MVEMLLSLVIHNGLIKKGTKYTVSPEINAVPRVTLLGGKD